MPVFSSKCSICLPLTFSFHMPFMPLLSYNHFYLKHLLNETLEMNTKVFVNKTCLLLENQVHCTFKANYMIKKPSLTLSSNSEHFTLLKLFIFFSQNYKS